MRYVLLLVVMAGCAAQPKEDPIITETNKIIAGRDESVRVDVKPEWAQMVRENSRRVVEASVSTSPTVQIQGEPLAILAAYYPQMHVTHLTALNIPFDAQNRFGAMVREVATATWEKRGDVDSNEPWVATKCVTRIADKID